ncbi:HEPN domain protein [Phycisphaerae bacterium RAS1]|nr:HEPN domain protein [Phycisphaerae bacterium RAS1]
MRPEDIEIREWLRKAANDLLTAKAGLELQPPVTDTAAFHCQQAVEKYLKAYLLFRSAPFEKTHDLEILVDRCARLDPDWEALRDAIEPLTAYAVRFRYPGPSDPAVDAVLSALATAECVGKFLKARLPGHLFN